jgi:hypothetical protein
MPRYSDKLSFPWAESRWIKEPSHPHRWNNKKVCLQFGPRKLMISVWQSCRGNTNNHRNQEICTKINVTGSFAKPLLYLLDCSASWRKTWTCVSQEQISHTSRIISEMRCTMLTHINTVMRLYLFKQKVMKHRHLMMELLGWWNKKLELVIWNSNAWSWDRTTQEEDIRPVSIRNVLATDCFAESISLSKEENTQ